MPRKVDIKNREELLLWNKAGKKRRCEYSIRSKDTGYDVILFKTRNKEYKGISLENNFERFATSVKKRELKNVHHNKIKWFHWDEWNNKYFDDRLLPVKMTFDGLSYSDPIWEKEVTLEE